VHTDDGVAPVKTGPGDFPVGRSGLWYGSRSWRQPTSHRYLSLAAPAGPSCAAMHPALLLLAYDRQPGGQVWRFKPQRPVRTVLVVVPT
jgi:hypothetical protein